MQQHLPRKRLLTGAMTAVAAMLATVALVASASAASGNSFTVTNLVSDQPGVAQTTDPSLVNAWGLTSLATSPWWVADNGQNVSTLYQANGTKVARTVGVANAPTGDVSNAGSSFVVTNGTTSAAALFIFATEEGTILGWNPNVSPNAVPAVPAADGAVFKGLTSAPTAGGDRLYTTDFHNGRVGAPQVLGHVVSSPKRGVGRF
jgi:uncharacterized protein (TIGR03118 family)